MTVSPIREGNSQQVSGTVSGNGWKQSETVNAGHCGLPVELVWGPFLEVLSRSLAGLFKPPILDGVGLEPSYRYVL